MLVPLFAHPLLKYWDIKQAHLNKAQYRRYLIPISVGETNFNLEVTYNVQEKLWLLLVVILPCIKSLYLMHIQVDSNFYDI